MLRNEESDTMQLRVFGDPGEAESFEFPDHLYAYLVWSEGGTPEVTHVQVIKTELNPSSWKQESNSGLTYQTKGDSLYVYTQKIFTLLKDKKRVWGKLYVFVSKGEVNLYVKDNPSKAEADFTEADVLNLVFDNSSSTIQANLKNLYSTPYNYEVNDKYYGTIANFAYDGTGESESGSRVAYANLLLYHVAAKVDLMWSVAEDKRIKANPAEAVRLTYLGVQHLFNSDAYCFKPMRNELATIVSEGYSIANIVTASDEGLWWEGRDYFYTIPYVVNGAAVEGKVYFPLQMLMRTNGSDGTGYQLTLKMQIDTSAVFVPWLRANFNLKQPLGNTSETKTVDYRIF